MSHWVAQAGASFSWTPPLSLAGTWWIPVAVKEETGDSWSLLCSGHSQAFHIGWEGGSA